MIQIPENYLIRRDALGFDGLPCPSADFELYKTADLAAAQEPHASNQGWRPEWIVIGREILFDDPIVLSTASPHPVYSAAAVPGFYGATPLAPSLDAFWTCLHLLRGFAATRQVPTADQPELSETSAFLAGIAAACNGSSAYNGFWALHADIDLDDYEEALEDGGAGLEEDPDLAFI